MQIPKDCIDCADSVIAYGGYGLHQCYYGRYRRNGRRMQNINLKRPLWCPKVKENEKLALKFDKMAGTAIEEYPNVQKDKVHRAGQVGSAAPENK